MRKKKSWIRTVNGGGAEGERGKYTKLDPEQRNEIKEGRVFAQICDKGGGDRK